MAFLKHTGKARSAMASVRIALSFSALFLGSTAMSDETASNCGKNPIERSICVYRMLLEDVSETYGAEGGGGISSLKQISTTEFRVAISQEERKDLITYEVAFGEDGSVAIVNRTTGVKTYD